jgi:MoaA/NifB/PqqE/SkfB family radical SAM enzyme
MNYASVHLTHLDNLWFQVSGTLCNIACTHCFNRSGPGVRTFGLLEIRQVRESLETACRKGVKEIFFTGGEPFLHPQLPEMMELCLAVAPTTVLTNGLLINDRTADRLAELEKQSRYSLEIRVSLDGWSEEMNDAIRGRGVFKQVMAALARLCQRGLLPLVTVVRTWREAEEMDVLAGFMSFLAEAGYARPRIKILPALPLGRELSRSTEARADAPLLSEELLKDFDRGLLMCSNSRLVTDRGVWGCPLLVEMPDARLGARLEDAASVYDLRHHACMSCYYYGTICGNVSPQIEGLEKPR